MPFTVEEAFRDQAVLRAAYADPINFRFPIAPHLIVAGEDYPPHVYVEEHGNGTWSLHGAMVNMLVMMASSMNFTYSFVRPPDGQWGRLYPDGRWSGMVGMIYRREADMALGPFSTTYSRSRAVSFTTPVVVDPLAAVAGRYDPEVNPLGFMLTFTGFTWLAFFVSMFLCITVLVAMSYENKDDHRIFMVRALDVTFEYIRSLFQQDLRVVIRRYPVRLLFGFWWLFILVMTRTYSSVLTSLLAVRTVPVPFKSIKDMINNKDVKIVLEAGSAPEDMFTGGSGGGSIRDVGKAYVDRFILKSMPEFYDIMVKDVHGTKDVILITEKLFIDSLINKNFNEVGTCHFYYVPEYLSEFKMAMTMTKNSPMLNPITARILLYHSMGLYNKWIAKETVNASHCHGMPGNVYLSEPYEISSLWAVFALTGVLLLLSCVLLLLELLVPHVKALRPVSWIGSNVLMDDELLNAAMKTRKKHRRFILFPGRRLAVH